MANLLYSVLGSENAVYAIILKIYVEDTNTLYKTWTTDTVSLLASEDALGDISSMASSTNLDVVPVSLSSVLSVAIPHNILYSRQIIGWRIEAFVRMTSYEPSENILLPLFVGNIGKIGINGNTASIELVSIFENLKRPSRYVLSKTCVRELGDYKCGVNVSLQVLDVDNVNGKFLTLVNSAIYDSNFNYEILIGDDSFLVGSYNAGTKTFTLDRVPLANPDIVVLKKYCNKTLAVCKNMYANNANFLAAIGINKSLLGVRL
jgi:hypothetical protein